MASPQVKADGKGKWQKLTLSTFCHLEQFFKDMISTDYPAWHPDNNHVWQKENILPQKPGDTTKLINSFKQLIEDEGKCLHGDYSEPHI